MLAPPIAKSIDDLEELDELDDAQDARSAFLRTLEYFGAQRLPSGELEVPGSLSDRDAPTLVIDPQSASITTLRNACETFLQELES
mmetsp:Transcript_19770/g.59987  ORF Transcript_19770/g.59987 Transcript_19770/m.59987 type:complete len:86 (-) Transcript_19770:188-445(-)